MAVTNYYTVGGEILGEHTVGQSRLDYLPDALGSVIGSIDQTLTVKSTARYKPYGSDLASTGTQLFYGWNGQSGYRKTGRPHSDFYVRMRSYGSGEGRWTTVDILWSFELAYIYCYANPSTLVDESGNGPRNDNCSSMYNNLSQPGRLPSQAALSKCKSTRNPGPCQTAMLSAGELTCIAGKEMDYASDGGDVGINNFQLTTEDIQDWCKQNRQCLPALLGVGASTIGTYQQCVSYISHNKGAASLLGIANIECNGLRSAGYKSAQWASVIANCGTCMDLTNTLTNGSGRSCPFLWGPLPTCYQCKEQTMVAFQNVLNNSGSRK